MTQRRQASLKSNILVQRKIFFDYDGWLLTVILLLLGIGLVMVASSSIAISEKQFHEPLYYFWRQSVAVSIGLICAFITIRMPLRVWEFMSVPMLIVGVLMLILVLLPGIGKEVNGSLRWIQLGPLAFQASEPMKICIIAYLAGYLVRQQDQVRSNFAGFIRPIGILTVVAGLLLLEPDFGASVVLFATALGMMFLAGVPISRFISWGLVAVSVLATVAVLSPYRMQRLMSFLDPWQDPYDSGFQLTQALIAFGRGDWFGVGLGSSVQKLFYLPEAHTDFIFAVLAEETGLFGIAIVIVLISFIVCRSFIIGQIAHSTGKIFAAYFAYGIGLIIGFQAFINIGVNMGLLPTKGLTLPLLSYGGNSIVVTCILLGVLLRIEYENRQYKKGQVPNVVTPYVA